MVASEFSSPTDHLTLCELELSNGRVLSVRRVFGLETGLPIAYG
jgi:hypothetical protein